MSSKEDVDVTHEDQQKINNFAKWNLKYKDLLAEYEVKKKESANLDDAEDEILICDSEAHPFLIGETFFHLPSEYVSDELTRSKDQIKCRLAELNDLLTGCKAQMQVLKNELYSKFGNHINLEEDA